MDNNDTISRKWLRTAITKMFGNSNIASSIDAIIDNAPTAEEKSYAMGYQDGLEDGLDGIIPKGEWIKEDNGKTTDVYRCSICGRSILLCKDADLSKYPFCHCGADMRGGSE